VAAVASVCVLGATGRLGQRCCALLANHPLLSLGLTYARDAAQVQRLQAQSGSAQVTTDLQAALQSCAVAIDFTAPALCATSLPLCAAHARPCVVASTGLTAADQRAIDRASQSVAIVQSANLSLGVQVLQDLVQQAAAKLEGFDIEIAEIHHRHKRDAPSGTACALGDAVRRGRGPQQAVLGRHGHSAGRADNEIGFAALRGGEVVGDHTVYFLGQSERLELTHRSHSADIFAAGALRAAAWLLQQKPGLYGLGDVIRRA
jgi:4-hydroxy-tetrahydrodipicolinate reductase